SSRHPGRATFSGTPRPPFRVALSPFAVNHVPILPQTAPTWRESIPQDAPPRPRGRTGRTRVVLDSLRYWAGLGLVVACLIGGYMGWRAWSENPGALAAPVPATPLREIVVRSDGVLDRDWVER